jgi:PiT family inorganic phosphate transporter
VEVFLFLAVAGLAYANGANDNFKGVATLWGAGQTSYAKALAWATGFTFLGSLLAIWAASGLVAKFNGSALLSAQVYPAPAFLTAVALGSGATVLLAARLGLPISTTHALTGALVGGGVLAAGFAQVKFAALGAGVVLPLLFSPLVSLLLTLGLYPLVARVRRAAAARECVCVDAPQAVAVAPAGMATSAAVVTLPSLRAAPAAECETGAEMVRLRPADALHWLSGAAISLARGLNDTPKIAALLLVASAGAVKMNFALVALAMAVGGALGAARVAQTMSKKITPMATEQAVAANLVSATLVTAASFWAMPVSTTHVTSGSIFGIGLLHRGEADWGRVGEILLSWAGTLPVAALLAAACYWLLAL